MPKNETTLPLFRATDSLWNRKVVSLLSSVMTVIHLLISCTSSLACWLHDLAVSMATGKRMCVFSSPWYNYPLASCLIWVFAITSEEACWFFTAWIMEYIIIIIIITIDTWYCLWSLLGENFLWLNDCVLLTEGIGGNQSVLLVWHALLAWFLFPWVSCCFIFACV